MRLVGANGPRQHLYPMEDATRAAALDLLIAVLDRRRSLEESLDGLPEMPGRDRAAAHRLAATVLRRLSSLDAVLDPLLRKAPPDHVRHILRLGAAGLLLLGTPAHAAVATAVSLARARGFAPFAGLVNAVLRRVADVGPAAMGELDGPRLDTPGWLWASWGGLARAIATAHQKPAPIDLTVRDANAEAGKIGGERLPTGSVRVPAGTRVAQLAGFTDGAFWVQDAAAAVPVKLLAPQKQERIADLCAAPGGKTAQLAAAGAAVTAVERDSGRAARLRENLARLRLEATVIVADAAAWAPDERFDAVLLDAPCTATGTIRRHPDVQRIKRHQDVTAMAAVQDRLLASARRLLRPGGRLVYSVCSLQPEEGAARVLQALAFDDLRLEPFLPAMLAGLPEAITAEGFLRTHPGLWAERGGMDGFFAARLIRQ